MSLKQGRINLMYIDSFDSLLIMNRKQNKIGGEMCQEKRNFVLIKTMKCATETWLQNLEGLLVYDV